MDLKIIPGKDNQELNLGVLRELWLGRSGSSFYHLLLLEPKLHVYKKREADCHSLLFVRTLGLREMPDENMFCEPESCTCRRKPGCG